SVINTGDRSELHSSRVFT
ncbi:hypothetical protein A2U01_0080840, partial [Trifolium medium]|nr:hypothetical protein [Trifolium medium]